MNTQETGVIIAENLSLKTYEKIEKHLKQCGETDLTLQRIKGIMQGLFQNTLSRHRDGNFDKGEAEFEEIENRILPFLQESMTDSEKESLIDDLWKLYAGGYYSGYISGARDIETILNDLTV